VGEKEQFKINFFFTILLIIFKTILLILCPIKKPNKFVPKRKKAEQISTKKNKTKNKK
jgi:uncharacterized membrane protein